MYMIPYARRSGSTSLMDLFDELERGVFGDGGRRTPAFCTDIKDAGDHYLLQAELPGFQKEDIDLDVKEGVLTITAAHKEVQEQENENYLCRERRYGSVSRSFNLNGIQEDAIRAAYVNGVLELTLPKQQEVLPQSRKIEIV